MAITNRVLFGILLCVLVCAIIPASRGEELPKLELNKTRHGEHTALEPLYDMIYIFLNDMVMPKTAGELIEEYEIESFADFADPEFLDQWKDWILYFLGFLICIASGIIFLVFLPCVGLCYCCCRCCGCGCCSHEPRKQGKRDKCKRICCGTSVFVVTSMMLAAACLFVLTQEFVAHEFKSNQLIGELESGVHTLETYTHKTVGDFDKALIQEIEKSVDKTVKILEEMPEESLKRLEEEYQLDSMLGELQTFVNNIEPLSDALGQMDNSTEILQDLTQDLETNLTASRESLYSLLNDPICGGICGEALASLYDLTVDATYENMSDVTVAKAALDTAIDANIADLVNEGIEAYEEIKIIILNETEEIAQEMIDALEEMEDKIREGYDQLLANVTDLNFDEIYDKLDDAGEVTEDIGHYYLMGSACFGVLLMLIVLFAWLGLCCGACCKAPKEGVGSCCSTTTVGSRCLMLSIAFTFIFGSLITLITVITFTAGGATELFLCRHLVTYDDTFQSYMQLLDLEIDYDITATQLIDDCRNNRSLYVAANFEENGFNLTELLDLEDIYDVFDQLANITIEIGNVTILDDEVTAILTNVSSHLNDIDYSSYEDELDKDITKIDLNDYADLLSDVVKDLRDKDEDELANDIEAEENILRDLANTTVEEIEDEREILQEATDNAIEISESIDLDTLLQNISDAEDKLNDEGLTVVTDYIVEVGDEVLVILEDLVAAVEKNIVEEVGNCRVIYEMGVSMVYTPCVYFLYPFNALWFCAGWFIFCCFFHLIFATKLAGLYTHYAVPEEMTFHERDDLQLVALETIDSPPPDYGDDDYDLIDTKGEKEKVASASGYDNATYETDKNDYNPPHYPSSAAMAKYHGVQVLPPYPK